MAAQEVGARENPRRRLRAHRTALGQEPPVEASGTHPALGKLRGAVVDASLGGLRLRMAELAKRRADALCGTRLEMVVECCGSVIYEGGGTVVRCAPGDGSVDLGIRLEQTGVNLSQIARSAYLLDVSSRWRQTISGAPDPVTIDAGFRAWVADLAGFLEQASSFMNREERALAEQDALSRGFALEDLHECVGKQVVQRMHAASDELNRLVHHMAPSVHEPYRRYLQLHVGRYLQQSPFLRRAYEKPLGYAGDYEMMNMLYRDHAEGDSAFGRALNLYATGKRVAQANINRIEYFGQRILEAAEARSAGRARVISVGCGPAHEVSNLLRRHPELGPQLDLVLIDQEQRAIAHCERTLAQPAMRTGATIHAVKEPIRRLLSPHRTRDMLGECDLIYSAGLFDYLKDHAFGLLLESLHGAVRPGGRLIIGNVAADNPERWAMEYFAEWFLQHRSPEDLLRQAARLTPPPTSAEVGHEPTGANLFLTLLR